MEEKTEIQKKEDGFNYESARSAGMFELDMDKVTGNNENVKKVFADVLPSLYEMGQIKSDIDCVLLTGGHEGNDATQFPASTFHFICRQMRFSISESVRLERDMRELARRIEKLKDPDSIQYKLCEEEGNFPDLEIEKLEHQLSITKIDFFNRATRTVRFKQIHDKLVEQNGGKIFTNEEYQKEQPKYYQWFMANRLVQEILAGQLNISKGLIDANQKLTQKPILENVTKQIENYLEIVDCGDGQYRFNIKFDNIFPKGTSEGSIRPMNAVEQQQMAMLKQRQILAQRQLMFGTPTGVPQQPQMPVPPNKNVQILEKDNKNPHLTALDDASDR